MMHSINADKPVVIVFSPVRVTPAILRETLHELSELRAKSFAPEFWFYDDNDDPESSQLLHNFKHLTSASVRILPALKLIPVDYVNNEDTHAWRPETVQRVIAIKNLALKEFLSAKAQAIFLFDSDLCLHPETVEHLYALELPIVSEVFWTVWKPGWAYMPNVWDKDLATYTSPQSILQLRNAGQYRVGGLGACTLVRREVIESGVSFSFIDNISFWGEDRHFCIRAYCNGFELYADTVFPPFHVYRQSLLTELYQWRAAGRNRTFFINKLDGHWETEIRESFKTHPLTGWLRKLPRRLRTRWRTFIDGDKK